MSTRGTVTIRSEDDRRQIATWARNVEVGTVVTFRKKSRSSEQSAKMWAMLHEVADQVEWYGAKLEAEDWKDMATASLRHARVVPGIDRGTYVPLGMHTSTMTIEEMTNLIEFLYAFGAEHGVIFKDPKEQDSGASSPPDAADVPPTSANEAGDSSPELPASNPSEWLPTVAKMLWAATHTTGDVDANLELLNNQRIACAALPGEPTEAEKLRAGSIYRVCKDLVSSAINREYAIKLIAGHAGINVGDV
jgi:hypothetical protein